MNIFGRPSAGLGRRSSPVFAHGLFARSGTKALAAPSASTLPHQAPTRPALARSFGNGFVSGEWPLNYLQQVREGYVQNAVAQRAVRLVAEAVGSVDVSVAPEHAGALALLNATSAGQVLMEAAAVQLLLHGNAYIQLISNGAPRSEGGGIGELFALRPDRVSIETDARGWPLAYVYRVGESNKRIPARAEGGRPGLVHIKGMHPLDDHYGLGALGAASGAIASHNAATKWNKVLLDNMARPSGALVYEPGEAGATLSAEQFDRLRAEVDAHFAGPANAGRPLLLEGGLKWQSLSLSPTDMDFINLKAATAREIALAFGVPPVLLGLPGDATYNNYREANRALWRMTILPLANKILDAIAEGMQTDFPGLEFTIDLDGISALAEDREKLWAQVSAATFLTNEEKRMMLGLQPGSPELNENAAETEL
jgi:HK97 family phage portal protein